MKVRLLGRETDLDLEGRVAGNAAVLARDLGMEPLLGAMAGGDRLVLEAARRVLFGAEAPDLDTIAYRQAVLRDFLERPALPRALYTVAGRAEEVRKRHYWNLYRRHPGGVLYGTRGLLADLLEVLRELRRTAERAGRGWRSEGLGGLLARLRAELTDACLDEVGGHLRRLRFPRGVPMSAALGRGNHGTAYLLHEPGQGRWGVGGLLGARRGYSFQIHDRDQAGATALAELRDRGLEAVAEVVGQCAEHALVFLSTLRAELAFYLGCLNLHQALAARAAPLCFPDPAAPDTARLRYAELYDPCLVLAGRRAVVGNDLDADRIRALVVTGANQGGKSTLLRALGIAQLMMQGGMFVAAQAFEANLCRDLHTHFPREEDAGFERGKLDEELARASRTIETLRPGSLLLLNESFASTNEREGSEIARQVVGALIEGGVKVCFVTHLHAFAAAVHAEGRDDVLCVRAERGADGRRTFKLRPGIPLATSFGRDLYREVFASEPG